MSTQPVPTPNMLPISRVLARRRFSAIRGWSFTLIAIVILLVLPSTMLSVHLRTAKAPDQDHITRFISDMQQLQTTLPPLKKRIAQLEEVVELQKCAKTRVRWTAVLEYLASLTTPDVRIHSFDAMIDSQVENPNIQLTFQIYTDSLTNAREFLVVIESTQLFDQLEMIESNRISSDEDALVNSTIRAQILSVVPSEVTP